MYIRACPGLRLRRLTVARASLAVTCSRDDVDSRTRLAPAAPSVPSTWSNIYNKQKIILTTEQLSCFCTAHLVVVPLNFYLNTEKHNQNSFFLNVCCVFVFYVVLCCSVCLFLYLPFCHGALKLDLSTLFTTLFSFNFSSIYFVMAWRNKDFWKCLVELLKYMYVLTVYKIYESRFSGARFKYPQCCFYINFSKLPAVITSCDVIAVRRLQI